MLQDIASGFGEALAVHAAQHGVQDDVIGFESGIGLEFAAPVASAALLGEEEPACSIGGGSYAA